MEMVNSGGLTLTNVILNNEYAVACQPYEYFFFRVPQGEYRNLEAVELELAVDSGEAVLCLLYTSLEPFCRMYEEQIMFPGVEGLDIDPLRTQFAAGKIGMYIYGNWESTIYAENGQFPAQCQWGVVPIPGVGTDNPTGRTDIKNAGKSWGIASTCQNPKEAWEYISYMLSDDYMTGYHEQGYGTVIIPSVVEKAKSPDIPGAKEFGMSEELDMIWPCLLYTSSLKA